MACEGRLQPSAHSDSVPPATRAARLAALPVLSSSCSSRMPTKALRSLSWLNLSDHFVLPCNLMHSAPAQLTPGAQPAELLCPCRDGHGHFTRLPLLLFGVILSVATPHGVKSWAKPLPEPQGMSGSVWHGQDGVLCPQLSAGRTSPGTEMQLEMRMLQSSGPGCNPLFCPGEATSGKLCPVLGSQFKRDRKLLGRAQQRLQRY